MALVPIVRNIDDARRAIQKLAGNKIGPNASPTFYNLMLTGLATGLLYIDADGNITAAEYVSEYGAFEVGA